MWKAVMRTVGVVALVLAVMIGLSVQADHGAQAKADVQATRNNAGNALARTHQLETRIADLEDRLSAAEAALEAHHITAD